MKVHHHDDMMSSQRSLTRWRKMQFVGFLVIQGENLSDSTPYLDRTAQISRNKKTWYVELFESNEGTLSAFSFALTGPET